MKKLTLTKILAAGIVTSAIGIVAPAIANSDNTTSSASIEALTAQLEGQGLKVEEIEQEDGYIEAEVVDAQGQEREIYFDAQTGEEIPEPESDDEDDDDKDEEKDEDEKENS